MNLVIHLSINFILKEGNMKRISYLVSIFTIMLFATPLCFGQGTYTNNAQNYSMYTPGTVDENGSTSDLYVMSSYNSNSSFGVGVIISNSTITNTRESLDSMLPDIEKEIGGYNCTDTTYNGDFAAICPVSTTNDKQVSVTGKLWVCIHNGYLYTVFAISSTNSTQIDSYLDSFVFLK